MYYIYIYIYFSQMQVLYISTVVPAGCGHCHEQKTWPGNGSTTVLERIVIVDTWMICSGLPPGGHLVHPSCLLSNISVSHPHQQHRWDIFSYHQRGWLEYLEHIPLFEKKMNMDNVDLHKFRQGNEVTFDIVPAHLSKHYFNIYICLIFYHCKDRKGDEPQYDIPYSIMMLPRN